MKLLKATIPKIVYNCIARNQPDDEYWGLWKIMDTLLRTGKGFKKLLEKYEEWLEEALNVLIERGLVEAVKIVCVDYDAQDAFYYEYGYKYKERK